MRRARGVLLPPIATARLRRGDVYRALRTAILDGVLPPGTKLPSSRHTAGDYGVSRGLVEEVFAQLTDEGFLERVVGRGTFIARTVAPLTERPGGAASLRPSPVPSRRGRSFADNAACREPATFKAFNAGVADTVGFPWSIWLRLHNRATRELGREALTFADPRGLPRLREAIARYLAQFRGIRCDAGQVAIFDSSQQALNVLAALLLDRRDIVWVEDPGYLGARAAFSLAGAEVVPIPVDDQGMRVDLAVQRAPRARVAYVTPSNQYPTGIPLAMERRIALLDWAAHHGGWIIEDDYDGEFRYEGQPLTPLCSLDAKGRVLYVGTLNKSMFVSLRLAFAVVPESLIEPLANVRTQFDGFTAPVRQMAMSLFMDEGHFSPHLRHMRAVYKTKRKTLVDDLAAMRPLGWSWPVNPAGMHLLVSHDDAEYVRTVARESSLDLALVSRYRLARARGDGLFLRFGALDMPALRTGAGELVATARAARRSRRRSRPAAAD